ncbi:hypothetical protein [Kribbella sp. NPDC004875]|uniref:hypothetical protein n=1 Tax=Kribbella sp. NPDC004875 TaxID=3364107 RepID=UPI0036887FBC
MNPISGTNWEGAGVVPDLDVPADRAFAEACRRAAEQVLALPPDPERNGVTDEARTVLGAAVAAG